MHIVLTLIAQNGKCNARYLSAFWWTIQIDSASGDLLAGLLLQLLDS